MIVLSTVAIKMEKETIDRGCHGVVAFRSSCLFPVLIWDDENENSSLVSQKTKPQTLNGIGPTNDLPGVNSRVGTISLTQKPQEKILLLLLLLFVVAIIIILVYNHFLII